MFGSRLRVPTDATYRRRVFIGAIPIPSKGHPTSRPCHRTRIWWPRWLELIPKVGEWWNYAWEGWWRQAASTSYWWWCRETWYTASCRGKAVNYSYILWRNSCFITVTSLWTVTAYDRSVFPTCNVIGTLLWFWRPNKLTLVSAYKGLKGHPHPWIWSICKC
jgi:hypothetical protein